MVNQAETNPCRVCHENNLRAKWNSEDQVGWVHCDECGNHSQPVSLNDGREAIIAQWNLENART